MPGCRTPFGFSLCISFKLSPALNLYLKHKLPTNCSSLPKHSPPMTGQLSNYMPQLGSNLWLSQLHPLRPNHIDQSQGSKLSKTDHRPPQTDQSTLWQGPALWKLNFLFKIQLDFVCWRSQNLTQPILKSFFKIEDDLNFLTKWKMTPFFFYRMEYNILKAVVRSTGLFLMSPTLSVCLSWHFSSPVIGQCG